jgi:hypothetical protein
LAFLAAALVTGTPARAQDELAPWVDVFVQRDPALGTAQIYFVDAISGLSTVISVDNGDEFTLVGGYVMYRKPLNGVIMRAYPDGRIEPHPFIQNSTERRVTHWVTSPDARSIAWTQVDASGISHASIAQAEGGSLREIPVEPPAPPLEIVPVALTDGMTRFYFDAASAPDAATNGPYAGYAEVHEYNLANATFRALAGEPGCVCGAAVTPDGSLVVRLELAQSAGPYNVRVSDLRSDLSYTIPAPGLPYPYAGALVLNAAGTFAAYSIASAPPAAEGETQQYALMFVDISSQQQILALPPGGIDYRAVRFIDDDSALMLVDAAEGSTYKLNLNNGELARVSDFTYLGAITLPS